MPKKSPEQHFRRAEKLFERGQWIDAIRLYERAGQITIERVDVRRRIIDCCLAMKSEVARVQDWVFEKIVLTLHRANATDELIAMGDESWQRGDYNRALIAYVSASAHYKLGPCGKELYRQGEKMLAFRYWEHVSEHYIHDDPDIADDYLELADFQWETAGINCETVDEHNRKNIPLVLSMYTKLRRPDRLYDAACHLHDKEQQNRAELLSNMRIDRDYARLSTQLFRERSWSSQVRATMKNALNITNAQENHQLSPEQCRDLGDKLAFYEDRIEAAVAYTRSENQEALLSFAVLCLEKCDFLAILTCLKEMDQKTLADTALQQALRDTIAQTALRSSKPVHTSKYRATMDRSDVLFALRQYLANDENKN